MAFSKNNQYMITKTVNYQTQSHMDSSKNLLILNSFPFLISILCFLTTLPYVNNTLITNNHKLIYKQCSNQTSQNITNSSLLTSLFQQFTIQSSKSKFFKTIVADGKTAISGTFECRNDLSPDDCTNCVKKFPEIVQFCVQARIQLSGCYAHYQEEGWPETNSRPEEILHKVCSKHEVKKIGFEKMKYNAFEALESGVMNGDGFYEMKYESIRVLAQCAGNLRTCDCGECVNNAVQIVEDECRYSVSGEVYLDSCFISYEYSGYGGYSFADDGIGHISPRFIAIAVGGLAVVLLGLGLCYFIRSCGKKREDW